MKGLMLKSFIVTSVALMMMSTANANQADMHKKAMKKMWVCETNASRAENDMDKKADESMAKPRMGSAAFAFAMKNCRDCTKISCTQQKQ